jgi:hypothetical protein
MISLQNPYTDLRINPDYIVVNIGVLGGGGKPKRKSAPIGALCLGEI